MQREQRDMPGTQPHTAATLPRAVADAARAPGHAALLGGGLPTCCAPHLSPLAFNSTSVHTDAACVRGHAAHGGPAVGPPHIPQGKPHCWLRASCRMRLTCLLPNPCSCTWLALHRPGLPQGWSVMGSLVAMLSSLQGISGAIRAYLQLHDRPAGGAAEDEEALLASMTPEEQKK